MSKGFIGHLLGRGVCAFLLALAIGGAEAHAQPKATCEDEIRSMRWLVQRYGSERTQLEFALATSEARRQATEERLKQLEDALKSAPRGQNPGPK